MKFSRDTVESWLKSHKKDVSETLKAVAVEQLCEHGGKVDLLLMTDWRLKAVPCSAEVEERHLYLVTYDVDTEDMYDKDKDTAIVEVSKVIDTKADDIIRHIIRNLRNF